MTNHEESQPATCSWAPTTVSDGRSTCRNSPNRRSATVRRVSTSGGRRQAVRDQLPELRPLQDLRHQGPQPEHHLGHAAGRRRAELPEYVTGTVPATLQGGLHPVAPPFSWGQWPFSGEPDWRITELISLPKKGGVALPCRPPARFVRIRRKQRQTRVQKRVLSLIIAAVMAVHAPAPAMAEQITGPIWPGGRRCLSKAISQRRRNALLHARCCSEDPSNPYLLENAVLASWRMGQFDLALPAGAAGWRPNRTLRSQGARMVLMAQEMARLIGLWHADPAGGGSWPGPAG